MLIRADAATAASLEVVRGAVGARSAAEVVRLLVRLAEDDIGAPPRYKIGAAWQPEPSIAARARTLREADARAQTKPDRAKGRA